MYPFNYPTPQGATLDIFDAPSTTTGINVQSWVKPPNVGMVWITAVGAGGGGGTGSGDGTFFGYGGGGGSGAIVNVLVPALFVPPELEIQVGQGGSVTTDALTAPNTIISYNGTTLILADSASNGGSATGSGATANGSGGAAGSSASSSVEGAFAPFAIQQLTSGSSGTAGSTAQVLSTTTWTVGGSSGSSSSYNGQYGYSVSTTDSTAGTLSFAPIQTFGGNRRSYSTVLAANTARYRAPNGAGGGGGGSRQASPTCPGHQGGHGLVIIVAW